MEETNFTPQSPLSPQPGEQPGAGGAPEAPESPSPAPAFDCPEGGANFPPPPAAGSEVPPVPPVAPPLSPVKQAKKALRRCSNRNSLLLLLLVVGTNLVALGVLMAMKLLGVRMSTTAFDTVANLISYGSLYLVMAPLLLLIGNAGQPHKVRTYFTPKAQGQRQGDRQVDPHRGGADLRRQLRLQLFLHHHPAAVRGGARGPQPGDRHRFCQRPHLLLLHGPGRPADGGADFPGDPALPHPALWQLVCHCGGGRLLRADPHELPAAVLRHHDGDRRRVCGGQGPVHLAGLGDPPLHQPHRRHPVHPGRAHRPVGAHRRGQRAAMS